MILGLIKWGSSQYLASLIELGIEIYINVNHITLTLTMVIRVSDDFNGFHHDAQHHASLS